MMTPGRATSTRRVRWVPLAAALLACSPVQRESGTAVIASGADLESANPLVTLHPLSRQVQRHVLFVTLVAFNDSLRPVPYFAREWTWAADGRSVTMTLDSTLHWHDGVATTAKDVAFTFDMARDSNLGSPRRGDALLISRTEVLGEHEVRLHFNESYHTLPDILAELPIVPRHLLDSVPVQRWRSAAFATGPVGNGPFRFAGRVAGRQWRFERNDDFPAAMGGPPALRHLVVTVVDESATKFAGLVSGELDMAGVSPTMARLVEHDSRLVLATPPVLFTTGLIFNTTRPPFDDVRVRRAFSLSLDRERIVNAAVAGFGVPALSAIPPGLPVSPVLPSLDAASRSAGGVPNTILADSLLNAAGWTRSATGGVRMREGRSLEVTLLSVGGGEMALEQLIQADLSARGIEVAVRVMELATFLATVRATDKTFDMVVTGVPGDIALGHLVGMFSSAQRGGALDYAGYHTPLLDTALRRARRAARDSAAAAWARVDSLLQTDAPVAWIYHARGVQGLSRSLGGVIMDLRGELVTVARWTHR